jgi:[ribosomal protein S18]-alanine N-acetyltransferase
MANVLFTLRRMETCDLPAVLAIERVAFSNPWNELTFWGEIQNKNISFPLVAVRAAEKKIIGYIMYWVVKDEVQVNNIAVDANYRRHGVAEGMLRNVLESVRNSGAAFVSLEVRFSNGPARALYAKLGFRPISIRKSYYTNPDEDAVVMGLYL